eukprot:508414-Rhodomonas_salina.1
MEEMRLLARMARGIPDRREGRFKRTVVASRWATRRVWNDAAAAVVPQEDQISRESFVVRNRRKIPLNLMQACGREPSAAHAEGGEVGYLQLAKRRGCPKGVPTVKSGEILVCGRNKALFADAVPWMWSTTLQLVSCKTTRAPNNDQAHTKREEIFAHALPF